nr:MAG TPA: protein of unknown function DUF859 [Caudoviricetes sp.]
MATWTSGVNNSYSLRMNAYEIGVNQAANSSTVRNGNLDFGGK